MRKYNLSKSYKNMMKEATAPKYPFIASPVCITMFHKTSDSSKNDQLQISYCPASTYVRQLPECARLSAHSRR